MTTELREDERQLVLRALHDYRFARGRAGDDDEALAAIALEGRLAAAAFDEQLDQARVVLEGDTGPLSDLLRDLANGAAARASAGAEPLALYVVTAGTMPEDTYVVGVADTLPAVERMLGGHCRVDRVGERDAEGTYMASALATRATPWRAELVEVFTTPAEPVDEPRQAGVVLEGTVTFDDVPVEQMARLFGAVFGREPSGLGGTHTTTPAGFDVVTSPGVPVDQVHVVPPAFLRAAEPVVVDERHVHHADELAAHQLRTRLGTFLAAARERLPEDEAEVLDDAARALDRLLDSEQLAPVRLVDTAAGDLVPGDVIALGDLRLLVDTVGGGLGFDEDGSTDHLVELRVVALPVGPRSEAGPLGLDPSTVVQVERGSGARG